MGLLMSEKKWVVLFPGANYSVDHPLLYYAGSAFEECGYQKLCIAYDNTLRMASDTKELIERSSTIWPQLNEMTNIPCADIVFVSKSMGTLLAPSVEEALNIQARHIFLTP